MDTLIELQDAKIGYEWENPLFASLNFRVTRCQHVLVSGPCGVGKSALVKTLLGLLYLWDGSYYAFGRDMDNPSAPLLSFVRKKIGILPDAGILIQNLTVLQNIALPVRFGQFDSMDRVRRLLEPYLDEFRIKDLLTKYPSELNLDQVKKIGFVRALINNPDLLILDDPFEGLDDDGVEILWAQLAKINDEKEKTILVFSRKNMENPSLFSHRYRLDSGGMREVS